MLDKDNFRVEIIDNFDFELRFIVKKEIDDRIDTFLFSGWRNFAYSVVPPSHSTSSEYFSVTKFVIDSRYHTFFFNNRVSISIFIDDDN